MSDVKDTLLPPTATPLAKALDILEERLFSLPVQMIVKDPATADVGMLDHLAWEHSVDVWDLDWPGDVKRDVIAIAAEVHRHKGTPFAIKRALEAFDVRTELLEWFDDPDGEGPGTFKVTAYAGRALYSDEEVFINAKMVHAIRSVVQRAAPVSRGFIMAVGAKLRPQPARMAVHASSIGFARFRMKLVQQEPHLTVAPATASHTSAISVTRAKVA